MLIAFLFGCAHRNYSMPKGARGDCHSICPDCGRRRDYDPETLKPISGWYKEEVTLPIRRTA